ncbi:flagellar biosynthesis protein FlhB [Sporanaerobium hydrogeniformans]|uniref:Flagellar biosynthesis protein FlhB n=1 Tax=Sporanaerobium hydrogeniformans TaxID=3072179 RepID=A0AC61DEJ2_9FIRM|nr:EscU/YscU/HrcU family type III secretion system export apparatus switch protein [Sporanaerobium hydrogeniformans]PHV71126.1 flagellar biosynthesis protein FlhB [Sporanaerobium hydrogeniformans]
MKYKHERKAAALSYNEEMTAPTVVASGKGKVAENILKEAEKHGVPVYQDNKLATILTEIEVGNQIPAELYELVAKIMVFVGDMDKLYAKTKSTHE